jgi:hypothetical protein
MSRIVHMFAKRHSLTAGLLVSMLALASCGEDSLVGQTQLADSAGTADGTGVLDSLADTGVDALAGTDVIAATDTVATTDIVAVTDIAAQTDAAEPTDTVAEIAEGTDAGQTDDAAPGTDAGGLCPTSQCEIGGACVANGAGNSANVCQKCLVLADRFAWSAFDGGSDDNGACDDGVACTVGDLCGEGQCTGTPVVCDDDNPCTNDSCCADGDCTLDGTKPGDCVALPNAVTCDDGDACTQGDVCGLGACGGPLVLDCDDGNFCTEDSCNSQTGCVHALSTKACSDGDVCTTADTCSDGACQGGALDACDDGDVCTVDSCDPVSGCQHGSIANLCTDDNPCTDAACDKVKGCVFPFNTEPCNDNNACTSVDTCTEGLCKGAAFAYDDNNLCTDETCDPAIGPVYVANTLPCDDNNACTLDDVCGNSACQPGAKSLVCADDNLCTDDACDMAVGCTFTDNNIACDDGTVCTKDDVCLAGDCTATTVVCDDGNDCTTDSCDAVTGCKFTLIVSNACRPVIEVDYPPRAATIETPSNIVTVTGRVKSGAGPITEFTLNGLPVSLSEEGTFTTDISAAPGGNTLVFKAKDSFETPRKRVQSFLWSTEYKKPNKDVADSGFVVPGVAFWLSQQVLDDGDHSLPPNDLATIFELFFANFDVAGLLPNPLTTVNAVVCGAEIAIPALTYDPAVVTLSAGADDTLLITANINKIKGQITAKGVSGIKAACNSTGNVLDTSNVKLNAELKLSVDPSTHLIVVTVVNSKVDATLNIGGFSGGLGFLINLLSGTISNSLTPGLETQLNDALVNEIGPVLGDALGALALDTTFSIGRLDGSGEKVDLNLQTDFHDVDGTTAGVAFLQRGRVTSTKAVPYENLGVPGRIGCQAKPQGLVVLKNDPLELALQDDVLNQLLHAAWYGGLIEFPVPPSMLGGLDLTQYGVTDLDLKLSAMLAPTVSDCNPGQTLDAHIGDLRVDAKLKLFGQPMDVVVYATITAGVTVSATEGAIGISLSELKTSELQVDVLQENLISSEAVLGGLIEENLIGALVGQLTGTALGSFPLPSIDLSGAVAGLPAGTGIAINPNKVTRVDGNSVIGGTLK